MMSLSSYKQAGIIDAFNTTFIYLDDVLNINNIYLTIWYVKYTLQNKTIPLILMPRFWTCI